MTVFFLLFIASSIVVGKGFMQVLLVVRIVLNIHTRGSFCLFYSGYVSLPFQMHLIVNEDVVSRVLANRAYKRSFRRHIVVGLISTIVQFLFEITTQYTGQELAGDCTKHINPRVKQSKLKRITNCRTIGLYTYKSTYNKEHIYFICVYIYGYTSNCVPMKSGQCPRCKTGEPCGWTCIFTTK